VSSISLSKYKLFHKWFYSIKGWHCFSWNWACLRLLAWTVALGSRQLCVY
jgi:hypothetical protein